MATLCFFHWAHRFRYALYDGLQLYHLNQLIAVLTYGIAVALTLARGSCSSRWADGAAGTALTRPGKTWHRQEVDDV